MNRYPRDAGRYDDGEKQLASVVSQPSDFSHHFAESLQIRNGFQTRTAWLIPNLRDMWISRGVMLRGDVIVRQICSPARYLRAIRSMKIRV
ncbi:hypothetical protein A6U86_12470 [Rhizobium sp. AC27/96]|nr:hypothetical protein A6U86_12470 [Rhizobium sp. AC27/96]